MKKGSGVLNKIRTEVKQHLSQSLFLHSIRVAEMAAVLAADNNINIIKVQKAALLHDLAKEAPKNKIRQWASLSGWVPDQLEKMLEPVLHAPAGEYLCRTDFDVKDEKILEAVRFHTIGSPNMSPLARMIFLADMIEPQRDFPGVAKIRRLAKNDFDKSLIKACETSIKYNFIKSRIIHPNTLLLRNQILKGEL